MDIPSLFMIPSAVSSGKVHSVFPNSTDADFDFNRDSSATRVNSQGLIETVGYFSAEQLTGFTNGTTYAFTTFTSSGNNITSAIVSSAFAGAVSNAISVTSGQIYRVTFDYTKNSGNDLRVVFSSSSNGAGAQISNNHLVSSSGSYSFDFTITSTTTGYLQMGTGNSGHSLNVSISNVSVKEIQGDRARLNYEIEGGLVNTKPSLLLEPQRTNTAEYSEDAAVYTYNDSTIRENVQIITPYGYKSQAVKIDAEFNEPYPIRAASFNLGSYSTNDVVTLSGFVKYNGYRYVQFGGYFGSESSRFDLINGVIIQNQSNVISSSMVKFPNDWYKLTVTYTFQNTIGNGYLYAGWVLSYNSSFAYTNARSGGIYVWGLQAELGSYATSYIPTNGSTQTRAAETCNGAGTSSILPSEEGILYAEIAALESSSTLRSISVSDGTPSNRFNISFWKNGSDDKILNFVGVGGVSQCNFFADANVFNFNKIAFRIKANKFEMYINGVLVGTDTSGNTYSAGTLNTVRFDRGDGNNKFYGKIRDIRVYNTKEMTDSEVDILLTKITS